MGPVVPPEARRIGEKGSNLIFILAPFIPSPLSEAPPLRPHPGWRPKSLAAFSPSTAFSSAGSPSIPLLASDMVRA